jgi:hypothetical protein
VVTDLLGGQVQILFGSASLTIEQLRAGKVRPLALTIATPWEGLPDIPTVGDFVPGYEASTVFGLGAPKRTPTSIIDKLNKEPTSASPIPGLKRGLPSLEAHRLSARPPTSATSLLRKSRSGARWSSFQARSRSDPSAGARYSITSRHANTDRVNDLQRRFRLV